MASRVTRQQLAAALRAAANEIVVLGCTCPSDYLDGHQEDCQGVRIAEPYYTLADRVLEAE